MSSVLLLENDGARAALKRWTVEAVGMKSSEDEDEDVSGILDRTGEQREEERRKQKRKRKNKKVKEKEMERTGEKQKVVQKI